LRFLATNALRLSDNDKASTLNGANALRLNDNDKASTLNDKALLVKSTNRQERLSMNRKSDYRGDTNDNLGDLDIGVSFNARRVKPNDNDKASTLNDKALLVKSTNRQERLSMNRKSDNSSVSRDNHDRLVSADRFTFPRPALSRNTNEREIQ
jgi:hypothetical protein